MSNSEKWRARADKLLSAPVTRQRDIKTVAGKVEDRFEAIFSARQRGMPWGVIAKALEDGEPIKADAVESAFKRICGERDITPPGQRRRATKVQAAARPEAVANAATSQLSLISGEHRWVDDGE